MASELGLLLISVICGWAVWFLARALFANVDSGTAVDRTLSEVSTDDAPGMFCLQTVGFVLLLGASACIGIWAIVELITRLVGGT